MASIDLESSPLIESPPSRRCWLTKTTGAAAAAAVLVGALIIVFAVTTGGASENFDHCEHVVIGAGFSSVYYAWRLALAHVVPASSLCVFEASPTRVGGRLFDFYGPDWDGLQVNLAAYRWQITNELVHNVMIKFFPIVCWDGGVTFPCSNTTGYYVVNDGFGNNGGFSRGIHAMLDELQGLGMAPVYMDHELVHLTGAHTNEKFPLSVNFANGHTFDCKSVFLGIAPHSVRLLNKTGSLLFGPGAAKLPQTRERHGVRAFLQYPEAWWLRDLNLTGGTVANTTLMPPVSSATGDGAVKCRLTDGAFSDHPVPGNEGPADCHGILRAMYAWDLSWAWVSQFADPDATDAATYYTRNTALGRAFLDSVHENVLVTFSSHLQLANIDPLALPIPSSGAMGVWATWYQKHLGGMSYLQNDFGEDTPDADYAMRNAVIYPVDGYDVFVANEGWANGGGWADPSLRLVERMLAWRFNISKPTGVSEQYYTNMMQHMPVPRLCFQDADCEDGNECTINWCERAMCLITNLPNTQPCDTGDLCIPNGRCESGACNGTAITCPGIEICLDGACIVPTAPPLPRCTATFGAFTLYWELLPDNITIRVAYSLPGLGYASMGWGSVMVGSDMVMGLANPDLTFHVEDDYADSYARPGADATIPGCSDDIRNVWAAQQGGLLTVWYDRLLDTGDNCDHIISLSQPETVLYAWTTLGVIGYHGANRGVVAVDLGSCT